MIKPKLFFQLIVAPPPTNYGNLASKLNDKLNWLTMYMFPLSSRYLCSGMNLYTTPSKRDCSSLLSWTHAIRYFCSTVITFCSFLLWNGGSFLVSWGHEVEVVVIGNGWNLITHGESHLDILYIWMFIKETFEHLFCACWLFDIANLSSMSLHPLLGFSLWQY